MRKVNFSTSTLEDTFADHGFAHRYRSVGPTLGAQRVGATIYEAQAGKQKSPFHYHYGWEEWLYVVSGAPVLRDVGAERTLSPGDVVCFPSGPQGAHTVFGPGRVVFFSTGEEPFFSAYPDSGKFGTPFGMFRHTDALEYWDAEGTAGTLPPPEPEEYMPRSGPSLPVVNALSLVLELVADPGAPVGLRHRRSQLGPRLGAQALGASVYALEPGEGTVPYHYEHGCEEWLLVLSGAPLLRHPDGEVALEPGDMVCFPDGPSGAHGVRNESEAPVRVMILSTKGWPVSVVYPDAGKLALHTSPDESLIFSLDTQVSLWDPPGA